jgi:hypothetical protein
MKYWNGGILGISGGINCFNCKKLFSFSLVQDKNTHHSTSPLFQYSNLGEAPKFKYVSGKS